MTRQSLSLRLFGFRGWATAKINTPERERSLAQGFGLSFRMLYCRIPLQGFNRFRSLSDIHRSPSISDLSTKPSVFCEATEPQTIHPPDCWEARWPLGCKLQLYCKHWKTLSPHSVYFYRRSPSNSRQSLRKTLKPQRKKEFFLYTFTPEVSQLQNRTHV